MQMAQAASALTITIWSRDDRRLDGGVTAQMTWASDGVEMTEVRRRVSFSIQISELRPNRH